MLLLERSRCVSILASRHFAWRTAFAFGPAEARPPGPTGLPVGGSGFTVETAVINDSAALLTFGVATQLCALPTRARFLPQLAQFTAFSAIRWSVFDIFSFLPFGAEAKV